MNRSRIALFLLVLFIISGGYYWYLSSKSKESNQESAPIIAETPVFNSDSAYAYIAKQVSFGPRIPNSPAQIKCKDWIVEKLKGYGWQVKIQEFASFRYDGYKMKGFNVIAQYQPQIQKRILLGAHWDARSIADKDSVDKNKPIDAANDGASGVGVMLEIARLLSETKKRPTVGVDLIFFDLEDHGEPHDFTGNPSTTSWALGSQHWATHILPENYHPYYGILLDMVGARGAKFPHEGTSMQYAPGIVRSIWATAADLGYGNMFIDEDAFGISDDHTAVNEAGKIQMIDIIDLRPVNGGFDFGSFHHTHQDNLNIIDKSTLKAVGQTLLQVLYRE